jgi:hypothetical protein
MDADEHDFPQESSVASRFEEKLREDGKNP